MENLCTCFVQLYTIFILIKSPWLQLVTTKTRIKTTPSAV